MMVACVEAVECFAKIAMPTLSKMAAA